MDMLPRCVDKFRFFYYVIFVTRKKQLRIYKGFIMLGG